MHDVLRFLTRKHAISDAAYIEKIREFAARRDRMVRWNRRVAIIILLFSAGLLIWAPQAINMIPGAGPGLTIGVIIGCN